MIDLHCTKMRPSTGVARIFALTSIWLGVASSLPSSDKGKDDPDVIARDVAIIGGGASGTYAAVRLKQLGQSVVLIEQEDWLGGHTNTYDDNGTPIDYGVWVYSNTTEARDFFAYLNISTTVQSLSRDPNRSQRYDFRTGESVPPPSGNVTEAMVRYVLLLLQYPYLENGWDLPDPVPEDLLLSFLLLSGVERFTWSIVLLSKRSSPSFAVAARYVSELSRLAGLKNPDWMP